MINPHLLQPKAKRWNSPSFAGGKIYLATFGSLQARRSFKRSSESQAYAERLIVRWRRLYDATIAEMSQAEPAPVPTQVEA